MLNNSDNVVYDLMNVSQWPWMTSIQRHLCFVSDFTITQLNHSIKLRFHAMALTISTIDIHSHKRENVSPVLQAELTFGFYNIMETNANIN